MFEGSLTEAFVLKYIQIAIATDNKMSIMLLVVTSRYVC